MERELNPYYNPHAKAGEEVSSTYEGRHVLVLERNLVHWWDEADPDADGLVDKGQPASFANGVGVALKSASSEDEFVPIDTEGIWRCEVIAWASVRVGQIIYIDELGYLTDTIEPDSYVFGYALQPIVVPEDDGGEVIATIAVKVHWMDFGWWWMWWGDGL